MINVLLAASYESNSLLVTSNLNIKAAFQEIACFSSCFFNKETHWNDFVNEGQSRRVGDGVNGRVNAMAFNEHLITIDSEAPRISQRKPS